MYETYYEIGGITIKIYSPFPFLSVNGKDFLCSSREPDYEFYFEQTNDIPKIMEGFQKVGETLWSHEYQNSKGTLLRAFLWDKTYYTEVSILGEHKGICYYASNDILASRAREGFELFMYLCLEKILIQFDALILHSSHIKINGKGLLFSAPSQVGKSTQAELWRIHTNATIINGDRSVLRKVNGHWQVFGCPMCGTSGIHRQSNEPLSNIVMLMQNQDNKLRRLEKREAFRLLYPQITISTWDFSYIETAMTLIEDLLENVPVWHYACTKEPEAVFYLKDALAL